MWNIRWFDNILRRICTQAVISPEDKTLVTELAGDGNQKVLSKRKNVESKEKNSSPKKKMDKRKGDNKYFTNGWFMVTDPKSKRILSVVRQDKPENNVTKATALEKIIEMYPNVDVFIHDRSCSFEKFAKLDHFWAKYLIFQLIDFMVECTKILVVTKFRRMINYKDALMGSIHRYQNKPLLGSSIMQRLSIIFHQIGITFLSCISAKSTTSW